MRFTGAPIAALFSLATNVLSFAPPSSTTNQFLTYTPQTSSTSSLHQSSEEDGMMNNLDTALGSNWMKPSPDEISGITTQIMSQLKNQKDKDTIYMDIGIGGKEFGTGPLSQRMYNVMIGVAQRNFGSNIPNEVNKMYLMYAMDASAKEAVRAAMTNNGYEMDLGDDMAMQDVGAWGSVEAVQFLDPITGKPIEGEDGSKSYSSWMDAIEKGKWMPGDGFSFVVRRVPSVAKAMDLTSILNALDPDGKLREEAKEKGILLPDEEVASLQDLSVDCMQRVNAAPVDALGEENVFRGGESKGYNVISRGSLVRNADGTENGKTLMHVMDALANHGCLIVDLTNEDQKLDDAITMSKMWNTVENFFSKVLNNDSSVKGVPAMGIAKGVGSTTAMVGYASFKDGDNQFLETRIRRTDGALLPEETRAVVGDEGVDGMIDSFRIMSDVGKDIVRIVTAASSIDAEAFVTAGSLVSKKSEGPSIAGLSFSESLSFGNGEGPSEDDLLRGDILASDAAALLAEEIMDDGKPLDRSPDEGAVSMSPHRICRYSNGQSKKPNSEVFGAHTDTSFVTIVPAAAVSGLEVFDEDELKWYRPELKARKHSKQIDPVGDMDDKFPWHSRYLIVMPGELLQICSRNNVPAVVHRVVASSEKDRYSAPVLLRARPGTKMLVEKYMGSLENADKLLLECDGMKMEEIHDALQVKPSGQKQ